MCVSFGIAVRQGTSRESKSTHLIDRRMSRPYCDMSHDVHMSRPLKVTLAIALIAAGLVGGVASLAFLNQQGLDRAEKWVSIVMATLSVAMAGAGLRLGWLSWRHVTSSPSTSPAATATGTGAIAVGNTNRGEIVTEITDIPLQSAPPAPSGGVSATGAGSVAIGGDNVAPIRTKISGPGGAHS
jgi:hypothetical protein